MGRTYIINRPHYVEAWLDDNTLVLQASILVPDDDPVYTPLHSELNRLPYTCVSKRDIDDDDDYWMWSGRERVWAVAEVSVMREEVKVGYSANNLW